MVKILSFDPSGNFKEGRGTTGICYLEDKELKTNQISAKDFDSAEEYWAEHRNVIERYFPDEMVVEGFKLYGHKSKEQINSELETPQLIGILKLICYDLEIPLTIQFASEVKTRWSDKVLFKKGILTMKGNRYYLNGKQTSLHQRDAIRHALHYFRYKR